MLSRRALNGPRKLMKGDSLGDVGLLSPEDFIHPQGHDINKQHARQAKDEISIPQRVKKKTNRGRVWCRVRTGTQ
jgi:hypothetical protein